MRRSAINKSGASKIQPGLCGSCLRAVNRKPAMPDIAPVFEAGDSDEAPVPASSPPQITAWVTRGPREEASNSEVEIELVKQAFRSQGPDAQPGKVVKGCVLIIGIVIAALVLLFVIGVFLGQDQSTSPPVQTSETTPLPTASDTTQAPPVIAVPVPQGARRTRPISSPGAWISTADYPDQAIRQRHEGTTQFRVEVSREGRVTGCAIRKSSGYADLDQITCRAISERARFAPATDEAGNPVPSTYSNSVRWVLPR